jgi:hypothetical protein
VHLIAKNGAADFTVNFSFFKWITIGDIKGWGQFSRVEPKRIIIIIEEFRSLRQRAHTDGCRCKDGSQAAGDG